MKRMRRDPDLLEKYDFSQQEAAKKLGTTQATISYYIHSKRGRRGKTQFEEMLPTIQVAARETAKNIATGKTSPDEVVQNFCKVCMSLRGEKTLETNDSEKTPEYIFMASGI